MKKIEISQKRLPSNKETIATLNDSSPQSDGTKMGITYGVGM